MVSSSAVSRSGDIVLVFNIKQGYLGVQDGIEEELNGWHGGPSIAESVTPLVYAAAGYGWYPSDNEQLPVRAESVQDSGGIYRNTDVRGSLQSLMTWLRGN
jgi:hypothetical protein